MILRSPLSPRLLVEGEKKKKRKKKKKS